MIKKIVFLVFSLLIGASSYAQQKKKTVAKSYTTEQAVRYAEDYFEFYEANTLYRNPIARKLSNNVFHINTLTIAIGLNYKM